MIPTEWLTRQRERRDQAEAQLLGTMLMFPSFVDQIVSSADPSRFERPAHHAAAEAIWECHRRHGTVDLEHVTDLLIAAGRYDELGNTGLVDLAACGQPTTEPVDILDRLDRRRSLYQASVDCMRQVSDPSSDPDDVAADLLAKLHGRHTADDRAPITTETLIGMDPPSWLVDPLIPQGLSMMFGSPKSGKSYLAVSLAWAVAAGQPWFGFQTVQAPVLYLVGEGLGDIRLRAEALHVRDGYHPGSQLAWWATSLRLAAGRDQARLRLEVARTGARLLVVDTWQRFAGLRDENDAAQTTTALSVLEDLAQDGVSVLLVHHRSKGAEVGARGSSALTASVESALLVERHDDRKLAQMSSFMARRGDGFRPLTFGWRKSGPDFVLERRSEL